ncbi:MAG: hypothetical protein H6831_06415 [Planctomycetes bacterium]|nr:hypothetical protein [Planctomycetota bacterium]MCB9904022.1 hypothetical protein [Planctomycetota bacterium]
MSANEPERRFDEETVLQWLLDADLRASVPRAELESSNAAELADLERFVAECRDELRAEERELAPCADRIVDAVLARTVSEDLGWRGDLRLVTSFMARRMRSSLLLRVAAASLLVHLIALPVIAAYAVWKVEQKPDLWIEFEQPPEQPYGEDPKEDLGPVEGGELPALDSVDALSLESINARNADRWSLFERGEELRAVANSEWDAPLERRLAARAARLIGDAPFVVPSATHGDAVDRLLAIDEALDARLLALPIPIDAADLAWLTQLAAGDPPRAALALAVLRRAQRYGVAVPQGSAGLIARLQSPDFADFAGLAGPAGEAPLSVEWVRALRACELGDGVSDRFVDALRR